MSSHGKKINSLKQTENERFKAALFNELLEYHFEKLTGKNNFNHFPWRAILEDKIEPHTDILCEFSEWLIDRGWDKEMVRKEFFVVATKDNNDLFELDKKPKTRWSKFLSLFRVD